MKQITTIFLLLCCFVGIGQTYKELLIEYQKSDFDYVINKGVPLCKKNYTDIDLQLLLGRAYADNLQYKEAIPYLRYVDQNAAKKGWRRGWCEIYLGICNFSLGEYEWARTYLNRALDKAATENIKKYAKEQLVIMGFSKEYKDFRLKTTDEINYHIHPKVAEDIDRLEKIFKDNEKIYQLTHSFFNCQTPKPIDLFIWENQEELEKALAIQNTGVARPDLCIVHANIESSGCDDIVMVISHFIENIEEKRALINIGTAKYLSEKDQALFNKAKIMIKSSGVNLVSVLDIWKVNRYDIDLYNYISGAFVEYLIEQEGKEKFLELFKDQSYYNAKKVYGAKIDVLIDDFEAALIKGYAVF